ncbi:MAG TPA: zinc ribbon domain-containing protein [Candidatus Bathyarchaeia archaeon]|nr:zinc ribbon domain-containing protein [Candidatus Bathyarchaeia archaeon]
MSQKCPNCGEDLLSTDVFCPYCGADTKSTQKIASPSSSEVGSVICESCGSVNPLNTQYCCNCGTGISARPYIGSTTSSSSFASSSDYSSSQSTYNYGASSSTDTSGEKPWYKPKPSKYSNRNPATWFYYFCWGFYVILRVLFWIFIIFGRGAMRRR